MEALSFLDVDLQSSLNIQAEIDKNVALIKAKEDKRKSNHKNCTSENTKILMIYLKITKKLFILIENTMKLGMKLWMVFAKKL